ncbi:hypothetical protein JYT97_00070 [Haliea sp. AH-315-K21]|nr:hypothetical protein [Haliea sp. AH-315-K21]
MKFLPYLMSFIFASSDSSTYLSSSLPEPEPLPRSRGHGRGAIHPRSQKKKRILARRRGF